MIGWGKTEEEGLLSKELRKVELPIIPQEVCRSSTGYEPGRVTDKMFCAGHLDGTKMDACFVIIFFLLKLTKFKKKNWYNKFTLVTLAGISHNKMK